MKNGPVGWHGVKNGPVGWNWVRVAHTLAQTIGKALVGPPQLEHARLAGPQRPQLPPGGYRGGAVADVHVPAKALDLLVGLGNVASLVDEPWAGARFSGCF